MFVYDLPRAREDLGLVGSYLWELWTHLNDLELPATALRAELGYRLCFQ